MTGDAEQMTGPTVVVTPALRAAGFRPRVAPPENRIAEALAVLRRVPPLPDTGLHGDGCHLRHLDCLAAHLTGILTGGAR